MSSIVTNASAIAALQTLRSVGSDLADTQNRISSGLRISEAADNAAYWSISTTMRSDKKAISAVSDALGLSSAMVDTAYTATSAIVDLLGEFKAKLVAASEPGVDKAKVQKELEQLSNQATSIADSASFNGQNWLNTQNDEHLAIAPPITENLVASFSRSQDGSVSLSTIDVDLKATSLFNAGGGGILQRDPPPAFEELPSTVANDYRPAGHERHGLSGPVTFVPGDSLSFDIVVDRSPEEPTGRVTSITIDYADVVAGAGGGTISHVSQWQTILNTALSAAGAQAHVPSVQWTNPGHFPASYVIQTNETSGLVGSSIYIENAASTLGAALGLTGASDDEDNLYESATVDFTGPFTLAGGIELNFNFKMNSDDTVYVKIDEDMVNATLGINTGQVDTASQFADIMRAVIDDALMEDQGLEIRINGNELFFTPNQDHYPGYGGKAATFEMSNIVSNQGWYQQYDLSEIDITSSQYDINNYITGVEHMEQQVIESAADLGALQSRIELQNDFAEDLMDTYQQGIGRLVDADMDQESTRLKALQTQQQLATQALSIANSNNQGLLQLFG